jgi:hypothetical protein
MVLLSKWGVTMLKENNITWKQRLKELVMGLVRKDKRHLGDLIVERKRKYGKLYVTS